MMKNAIALNGSYFNTYRMMDEYVSKVYFPLENRLTQQSKNKKIIKKTNGK